MNEISCGRGLRIPAASVIELIAQGMPQAKILGACPDPQTEGLAKALRLAADPLHQRALPPPLVSRGITPP